MEQVWYEKGSCSSVWGSGSGSGGVQSVRRWFTEMIWLPLLAVNKKVGSGPSVRLLFIAVCLFIGAFVSTRLLDATVSAVAKNSGSLTLITKTEHIEPSSPLLSPNTTTEHIEPSLPLVSPNTTIVHTEPSLLLLAPNTTTVHTVPSPKKPRKKIEFLLNCSLVNLPQTCPNNYYPKTFDIHDQETTPSTHMCPEYFRWIYEDLKPWAETGITEEMVKRAKRTANFRLVILNGTAYVETYVKSFQSRDVFTLWGILQLLRRYPGKVPDLDLMFDCVDWPVVLKKFYRGRDAGPPPPLFRYCGDDSTLDIVFPDWSFWGWSEINIRPWDVLLKDLEEGNKRTKWIDREPYAYWKGNPFVAETRKDLLKCNVSDQHDWNARIYIQDWGRESQEGFKQSNLASQCVHRYKIYIEGSAWSVSQKYILACDSVTLLVKPRYYDFFTRGLMPVRHYWPINEDDKCRSIKFAVDWGNSHKQKAQEIGREGSNFIYEHLKMEYVYDYMFHLLNEYSKLMKYKPRIPLKAVELCSESMGCSSKGYARQFMMESMVKGPADMGPCTMHPPFHPQTLKTLVKRKSNSIKTVEKWEREYYENQTNQG